MFGIKVLYLKPKKCCLNKRSVVSRTICQWPMLTKASLERSKMICLWKKKTHYSDDLFPTKTCFCFSFNWALMSSSRSRTFKNGNFCQEKFFIPLSVLASCYREETESWMHLITCPEHFHGEVLEVGSGDGCTAMWMDLMPLNWTLKFG